MSCGFLVSLFLTKSTVARRYLWTTRFHRSIRAIWLVSTASTSIANGGFQGMYALSLVSLFAMLSRRLFINFSVNTGIRATTRSQASKTLTSLDSTDWHRCMPASVFSTQPKATWSSVLSYNQIESIEFDDFSMLSNLASLFVWDGVSRWRICRIHFSADTAISTPSLSSRFKLAHLPDCRIFARCISIEPLTLEMTNSLQHTILNHRTLELGPSVGVPVNLLSNTPLRALSAMNSLLCHVFYWLSCPKLL